MPTPRSPWSLAIDPPPRITNGGNKYRNLAVQSLKFTTSWGSSPGSGSVVYVNDGSGVDPNQLEVGSVIKLRTTTTTPGYYIAGIVKSDAPVVSSSGHNRELTFDDMRSFLDWDDIYCSFNNVENIVSSADGKRYRRYWHIYPGDFDVGRKSYTPVPLTAAEILMLILTPTYSPNGVYNCLTTETDWCNPTNRQPAFHAMQTASNIVNIDCRSWQRPTFGRYATLNNGRIWLNPTYPVLDLNWEGVKIGAAVTEICEKQGLTFTLKPIDNVSDYHLEFARKGASALPTFTWSNGTTNNVYPQNSDERRRGKSLSGNPTRIRVLGGRNLYQVYNLHMNPDWPQAWNSHYIFDDVINRIYTTRYSAYPDQLVGYQLAASDANTITVAQYAALVGDPKLLDHRKFAGRSRNDMPVALYLKNILFRAFRPDQSIRVGEMYHYTERYSTRNLCDLQIVSDSLSSISVDPSNEYFPMSPSYDSYTPNGAGMACVQGYCVGDDAFKYVNPETFRLPLDTEKTWQPVTFSIDETGDEWGQFILFETPVYILSDFFTSVAGPGGTQIFVPKGGTITPRVPNVLATLTFAAERFSSWVDAGAVAGTYQKRDKTESVSNLYGEWIVFGNILRESQYSDGIHVYSKAEQIGWSILNSQFSYDVGGFVRKTQLTDAPLVLADSYDRLSIDFSPSGYTETVDFTTERDGLYQPERDLDRWRKEERLFPGQKELIEQSRKHRTLASGMKQSHQMRRMIYESFNNKPLGNTRIKVT